MIKSSFVVFDLISSNGLSDDVKCCSRSPSSSSSFELWEEPERSLLQIYLSPFVFFPILLSVTPHVCVYYEIRCRRSITPFFALLLMLFWRNVTDHMSCCAFPLRLSQEQSATLRFGLYSKPYGQCLFQQQQHSVVMFGLPFPSRMPYHFGSYLIDLRVPLFGRVFQPVLRLPLGTVASVQTQSILSSLTLSPYLCHFYSPLKFLPAHRVKGSGHNNQAGVYIREQSVYPSSLRLHLCL